MIKKPKKVIHKPKPTDLKKRLQELEDKLILQNNRIVTLEQKRHEDIKNLVYASIKELRQEGKFK